jgi:hypothetical protein
MDGPVAMPGCLANQPRPKLLEAQRANEATRGDQTQWSNQAQIRLCNERDCATRERLGNQRETGQSERDWAIRERLGNQRETVQSEREAMQSERLSNQRKTEQLERDWAIRERLCNQRETGHSERLCREDGSKRTLG